MDGRRVAGGWLLGLIALAGCQRGTVTVAPDPQVGDRARYRYEIVARITSRIDGRDPKVTEIDTTLVVDQETTAVSLEGIEADVVLRRDRRAPQATTVVLDATGAIRDVDLAAGLGLEELGLSQLGALVPPTMAPPRRALSPGARWAIEAGPVDGHGRLLRLGVEHDADVAVVRTEVGQEVDEVVTSGASVAELRGRLTSLATAAYALDGGTMQRSTIRSTGDVRAAIQPPTGIDVAAVLGTITYDIQVRATRLR